MCTLSESGTHCWGANASLQLGYTLMSPGTPGPVPPLSGISELVQIGAGPFGTAAVARLGEVAAWGSNGSGQLGDGTSMNRASPVRSWMSVAIVEIQMGSYHSCGRTSSGAVYCAGSPGNGALGFMPAGGVAVSPPTAVPGLEADQLSTSGQFTCARRGGLVRCWGVNARGQCGQSPTAVSMPSYVPALSGATDVSAGVAHACAIAGGQVYCWGDNANGQLGGEASLALSAMPVRVVRDASLGPLPTMVAVAAGHFHSCALSRAGEIFCWGSQTAGQLGDMAVVGARSGPIQVRPPSPAIP